MASEEQYGDMFCIVSTVLGVILSVYETPEEQSGLKKYDQSLGELSL